MHSHLPIAYYIRYILIGFHYVDTRQRQYIDVPIGETWKKFCIPNTFFEEVRWNAIFLTKLQLDNFCSKQFLFISMRLRLILMWTAKNVKKYIISFMSQRLKWRKQCLLYSIHRNIELNKLGKCFIQINQKSSSWWCAVQQTEKHSLRTWQCGELMHTIYISMKLMLTNNKWVVMAMALN